MPFIPLLLISGVSGIAGFFAGNKTNTWIVPVTIAGTLYGAYKFGLFSAKK